MLTLVRKLTPVLPSINGSNVVKTHVQQLVRPRRIRLWESAASSISAPHPLDQLRGVPARQILARGGTEVGGGSGAVYESTPHPLDFCRRPRRRVSLCDLRPQVRRPRNPARFRPRRARDHPPPRRAADLRRDRCLPLGLGRVASSLRYRPGPDHLRKGGRGRHAGWGVRRARRHHGPGRRLLHQHLRPHRAGRAGGGAGGGPFKNWWVKLPTGS